MFPQKNLIHSSLTGIDVGSSLVHLLEVSDSIDDMPFSTLLSLPDSRVSSTNSRVLKDIVDVMKRAT